MIVTTFAVARGGAAPLKVRIDRAHLETLRGLKPGSQPLSPPSPGTNGDALSTAQLQQIQGYL